MSQTTLETDSETLSYIKLYCNVKHIPQKDFLKHILSQSEMFKAFVKNCKKLRA